MTTSNKVSRDKKLAGLVTGAVSLVFLTAVFFVTIVIPVHSEIVKPRTKPGDEIPIETFTEDPAQDKTTKASLSSELPAGLKQSIVKTETKLFSNSFSAPVAHISQPAIEIREGEPGKSPDHSLGGSKANADESNETGLIGGNLKSRKLIYIDKTTKTNEEGVVVVKTTVDQNGIVTATEIDHNRTTTTSTSLRNTALQISRSAVFEASSAAKEQTGFITFRFEF